VKAPAKINLYLGVHTDRDERGYHRVDSVMAALDFGDVVTLTPAEGLSVTCEPGIRAHMDDTTTYRAVEALGKAFGHDPAFAVHIERHIPERSGMGGSSTDAGAALRGACQLWGIDPEDARVVDIARSIGADVAFFLKPDVSYLAGAGDVLQEQFPTPSARTCGRTSSCHGILRPGCLRSLRPRPSGTAAACALSRGAEDRGHLDAIVRDVDKQSCCRGDVRSSRSSGDALAVAAGASGRMC
jgi:hypothetical protein